jgi:ribosome-associated heat shock protein Hsp15
VTGKARQRIDRWLYWARIAKTRAEAARMVAEGGVRVARHGHNWRLNKASAEIEAGDVLLLRRGGALASVRVLTLAARRGPPAEARALYSELDAEGFA